MVIQYLQYIQHVHKYRIDISHPPELKHIVISVCSDAATFECKLITDTNTQRHRDTEIEYAEHTATHCNTLQYTTTHTSAHTLQHTL